MATQYDITFASALDGSTGFETVTTAEGDLAHNSGTSPLDGSTGYATLVINETTADFGVRTFTAYTSETVFHASAYIDVGDLAISTDGHSVQLWSIRSSSSGYIFLEARNVSGTLTLRMNFPADGDGPTGKTADLDISSLKPTWHEIVVTKASNGTTAGDGSLLWYVGGGDYSANGQLVASLTGVDWFDRMTLIDRVRAGATNIGASASATTIKLDRIRQTDGATFHLFSSNAAPTVSDPGTIETALDHVESIGTQVTIGDTDGNLSMIRYQGTSGKVRFNYTASGTSSISAGANNSNDLTITADNQTDLLAAHALTTMTCLMENSTDTVTITATDDAAAFDSQAFTVDGVYLDVEGASEILLNAYLATLTVESAVAAVYTLNVTGIDDQSLEGTGSGTVTVNAAALTGAGAGVSHAKLSHTVGLHF